MATASWTCSVLESDGGAFGCSGCGMPHLHTVTASLLEHPDPAGTPLRPEQHGHAEFSVSVVSTADIPVPRANSAQRSTASPGRDCTTSMRARMSRVTTAIDQIIPPGGVESSPFSSALLDRGFDAFGGSRNVWAIGFAQTGRDYEVRSQHPRAGPTRRRTDIVCIADKLSSGSVPPRAARHSILARKPSRSSRLAVLPKRSGS